MMYITLDCDYYGDSVIVVLPTYSPIYAAFQWTKLNLKGCFIYTIKKDNLTINL